MSRLTTGQIGQLIEIDRAGIGIGDQVQELIVRLTSGGVAAKMTDPRQAMAKHLWDRGFGRDPAVKDKNFKTYLQGIPQISPSLLADDDDLPLLSLADPRPGLLRSCQLLGIQHEELGYSEGDAVPFDERFAIPATPFWFRHDDGRKNRERRPDHCRDELATGDIRVGVAIEGIFAFAHHPTIVVQGEYVIDLPGTVHHSKRVLSAGLGVWNGRARLSLNRYSGIASPLCGALRVRWK